MNRDLDERIRQRAYQIWEEEGRPDGEDFHHWFRAVEEIKAEHGDEDRPAQLVAGTDVAAASAAERPDDREAANQPHTGNIVAGKGSAAERAEGPADERGGAPEPASAPSATSGSSPLSNGNGRASDPLHAAPLKGATAAPVAQGTPVQQAQQIPGKAADRETRSETPSFEKHRKLAEHYLSLGGHRRAKIDDNKTSTREWRPDPPEAERFWSEKIAGLAEGDRRQVELLLPTINNV